MNEATTFEALQLAAPLQRALRERNYTAPTPIQAQAIPPQLERRDLMGCARTGTGKTAAFALPILHHLANSKGKTRSGQTRTLVLTPTRELAVQVGESFSEYGKYLKLRHALVYGGVSQVPQVRALRKGLDILVATPGRLIDLLDQGRLDLSGVEFLVLDEVDRMLDMGFIHDVRRIAEELPKKRQTSLYSATITREVEKVAQQFVNDPVRIEISPDAPVTDKIHQQVCHVQSTNKLPLLEHLLGGGETDNIPKKTLVFSRTKFGADKLARKLDKLGYRSEAIHGNKSQAARQRALNHFRDGRVPVLVATDVAARGIDVKDIHLVVNYDLPDGADTYVHRIGRTARAESRGRAVSFCESREIREFRGIERTLKMTVEMDGTHPYHQEPPAAKAGGGQGKQGAGKGKRPYRFDKNRGNNKGKNFSGRKSRPASRAAR
ncbi:MAG: DEAD/DEAH box helicase [Opitutales bacterium]